MNLIAEIVKNGASPTQDDCFEGMEDEATRFSFKVEMSTDERRMLLEKVDFYTDDAVGRNNRLFQLLEYEVSFKNSRQTLQKILASDAKGKMRAMHELSSEDGSYKLGSCDIESMDFDLDYDMSLHKEKAGDMTAGKFLDSFDPDVSRIIAELFSVRSVGERRDFHSSAAVGEDRGVSSDGENLPNQLMTMYNDRSQIRAFGDKIRRLSSDAIAGVDSQLSEKNAVIQLRERGRKRPTAHSEISSGHRQQVVLQHILYRCEESIIMMEEPELHLHPAAQKKLLDAVRNELPGRQLIIATHSPIFVNVSDAESVFLLSKHDDGSSAIKISPADINLIRSSMGISYADVLDSDYLCCAEGKSEDTAIPALARTLGYEVALAPWTLDIEGCGNAKHLGPLIRYLKMSGKKIFVLLDKDSRARKHVDKLVEEGVLAANQCHFLDGDFEDLFPSAMLARYSRQLAKKHGVEFGLSAEELDRRRRSSGAVNALQEEWKRLSGRQYPKAELAKRLSYLKRDDIPKGAEEVVRKIMEEFGVKRA